MRDESAQPLMRHSADQACEIEVARARKRLARGEDPMEVLEALGRSLTNKLLHAPLRALNGAGPAERDGLARNLETCASSTSRA